MHRVRSKEGNWVHRVMGKEKELDAQGEEQGKGTGCTG